MIYFAKWKVIAVLAVCILGLVFAAPNFLGKETASSLPDWAPHKQVSLGLDLQGGAHLLLEVKVDTVIREYLESTVDAIRQELRKERIRYGNLGIKGNSVSVTIRDADKVQVARDKIRNIDRTTDISIVDDTQIVITLTEQVIKDRRSAAVKQSIEIVRRRIDETGTREPTIQRQGDDRILVQLPGVSDPERVKRLLGKTAKMSFHLTDTEHSINEAMSGRVPPGSKLMQGLNEEGTGGQPRMYLIRKRVMVSGDTLVDSQPGFDSRNNEPVVNFRFNSIGAKRFGDATANNVGKPFAIVLDGKVISAPRINEPILGGSGQISGSFTVQTANDLALLLRAGALPAPLIILEERSVGPGLGADSIAAGKLASILGMIAVIVFMVVAYGRFGMFADVALTVNIFLILAALSLLQATLTLPGIAGIVLTIGMAVDANVLVFERIREELRNGRTPISAIDAGYSKALSTIIDANVTTLIAAVLLYSFGSGPIRGFAVTLAIGIVTSLFTAVMVTRLLVVTWLLRSKPKELSI